MTSQTASRLAAPSLPVAAAVVTVVLWASAFVGIRQVGNDLSPGALTLGRLLVGSVLLGAAQATRTWVRPTVRQWRLLLLCGLMWFGVYNLVLNAAERRLDAGTTAMLVNVGPLLIAALAGWLLHEGFPRSLLLGSAVSFAGVLVIGTVASDHSAEGVGVLLCLLAAVAYAIGVVAQKPLLPGLPALQVTWLACTTGMLACLPFLPQLLDQASDADGSTLAVVAYLGAFPTAIAFGLWAYALSTTSAGRMGATTYLVPPLAILLGWLLLDEVPAGWAYAGGCLCLAGVVVARRGR